MKRTILFVSICIIAFCTEATGQNLNQINPKESGLILQGYWKYENPENDELLIVKIKALRSIKYETSLSPYSYIGSYLYIKNGAVVSNNLSELDPYLLLLTTNEYSLNRSRDYTLALGGWMTNNMGQIGARISFDDHSRYTDGTLLLTLLSAEQGNEQLSWVLEETEGDYTIVIEENDPMTAEEIHIMYDTFSVPQNIILTKIHNLREFSNRGIILDPIPEVLE